MAVNAEDTSDHLFTTVERTLVDWCEANGFTVEHVDGEWMAAHVYDEEGWKSKSLSEMAYAVCEAIARARAQGGA